MESAPAEKTPVRVSIFNQNYTLLAAGDPREVEEIAHIVDELMVQYARAGNVDTARTAVLACLHLADQLRTLERDLAALKDRVAAKSRQLTVLLDQVIE
jgi:cell division protein ZapA